jgi:anti-sigma factor RsiW
MHHEVEELLGAYALDAVDADEAAAVEAHLAECPRCRAEVDAHREVAAHLANAGAPAPGHVWDRIAGSIAGEEPPPLRLVVDEGRARPPAAGRRGSLAMLAAAAVVAAALVVSGFLIGNRGGGGDGAQLQELAMAALESPDASVAPLVTADGEALARAVVLPDGTGYLLASSLPDLEAGTYQLWGSDGGAVVSLGVMGPAPDVVAFAADPGQTTLMVTAEDEPVERSEQPPVVVGELA